MEWPVALSCAVSTIKEPCEASFHRGLYILLDTSSCLKSLTGIQQPTWKKPPHRSQLPPGRSRVSVAIRVSTSISCVKAAVASCVLTSSVPSIPGCRTWDFVKVADRTGCPKEDETNTSRWNQDYMLATVIIVRSPILFIRCWQQSFLSFKIHPYNENLGLG
jgi:hypothetical protein